MPSQRMLRVNELLKREIADLIEKEGFSSETGVLLTIKEVNTIPELTASKVLFTVMPDNEENERKAMKFLLSKRKDFQKTIAKDIKIKNTPILQFEVDKKSAIADNVLTIIDELGLDDEL